MCGIAGYVGQQGNVDSLKLLSIYNVSRGEDSCGIVIDDNIMYGLGKESKFTDFARKVVLPKPEKHNTMLSHTRKASVGKTFNHFTCHPHGIFKEDDKFEYSLIGVHNGTISNWKDLAKYYAIDTDLYQTDSAVLFAILADGNYEVLTDYEGGAAIMFYEPDDPNSLYVFQGFHDDKRERPLFMLEEDHGIYFSSLEAPLEMIRTKESSRVDRILYNTLIKISDDGERTIIGEFDRTHHTDYNYYNYSYGRSNTTSNKASLPINAAHIQAEENNITSGAIGIVFKQGRYRLSGKLVTGAYEITSFNEKGHIKNFKKLEGRNVKEKENVYFFYQGILIQDFTSWKIVTKSNVYSEALKYATHPHYNYVTDSYWWGTSKVIHDTFDPFFSQASYYLGNEGRIIQCYIGSIDENPYERYKFTSICLDTYGSLISFSDIISEYWRFQVLEDSITMEDYIEEKVKLWTNT